MKIKNIVYFKMYKHSLVHLNPRFLATAVPQITDHPTCSMKVNPDLLWSTFFNKHESLLRMSPVVAVTNNSSSKNDFEESDPATLSQIHDLMLRLLKSENSEENFHRLRYCFQLIGRLNMTPSLFSFELILFAWSRVRIIMKSLSTPKLPGFDEWQVKEQEERRKFRFSSITANHELGLVPTEQQLLDFIHRSSDSTSHSSTLSALTERFFQEMVLCIN